MVSVSESIYEKPIDYQNYLSSNYTSYYDFFNATVYSEVSNLLLQNELTTLSNSVASDQKAQAFFSATEEDAIRKNLASMALSGGEKYLGRLSHQKYLEARASYMAKLSSGAETVDDFVTDYLTSTVGVAANRAADFSKAMKVAGSSVTAAFAADAISDAFVQGGRQAALDETFKQSMYWSLGTVATAAAAGILRITSAPVVLTAVASVAIGGIASLWLEENWENVVNYIENNSVGLSDYISSSMQDYYDQPYTSFSDTLDDAVARNLAITSFLGGEPFTYGVDSLFGDFSADQNGAGGVMTGAGAVGGMGQAAGTSASLAAQALHRRISPIALDLDGDGMEVVGGNFQPDDSVYFDLTGDGVQTKNAWLSSDDAWLALDRNNNGTIDTGRELFGEHTPLQAGGTGEHGYIALKEYDLNNDDLIDASDAIYSDLKLWRDTNQDGISQADELKGLLESGV